MKIGDKIMCKNSMIGYIFIKNEFYTITDIDDLDDDGITIILNEQNHCRLNITYPDKNYRQFYDYFYTIQEIRQLKLESL